MKLRRLNSKGFSYHVGLVAVAVLFGIVGTFLLLRSHAATLQYLGFNNYTTGSGPTSSTGAPTVFTSQDSLPGIGTQYVSDIAPGGKLYYNYFPGKAYFSQICYYVRVYNSPKSAVQVSSAYVTFAGLGNQTSWSLPADNNYHSVCVPSGTGTQQLYSVWNHSSYAYVLVYQSVSYH